MSTETCDQVDSNPTPEPPIPAQKKVSERIWQLKDALIFRARPRAWHIIGVACILVIGIAFWRNATGRARERIADLHPATTLVVPAARVVREDIYNEVTRPAEFRPFDEVELHAKISGYVKEINVDFGDRVKAGQLMAVLEVPELGDELHRAFAAQKRAEADYRDAHAVYLRLQAVIKEHPNLVAQQELDAAESKDGMAEASIAAAKADVEKYQTLISYTRITAPFDGVVTHRYVDKGALIQAGTTSETQSLPLVRVSDNYRLRLDFPVDVLYVSEVHPGDAVEVRVESLGDRTFTGKITRSTMRVNQETRTMTTEIEVPNSKLELVPGMYARVLLKVQRRPQALAIPVQAVPPGQTTTVLVINAQSEIEERPVSLGLDTPTQYEVISGLKEGDIVLVGSRSQVHLGQKVEPKIVGSLAQQ